MAKFIEIKDIDWKFNFQDYLRFLDDDDISSGKWYGISIQYNDAIRNVDLVQIFNRIVCDLNNELWLVKHDDKLLPWFPYIDELESFPKIRGLFFSHEKPIISNEIIEMSQEELGYFAEELSIYPYKLSYKNIDCISRDNGIVLKWTSHMTLDVISTSPAFIDEVRNKVSIYNGIQIINYNTLH